MTSIVFYIPSIDSGNGDLFPMRICVVTTVVIPRKNMRQRTQSEKDAKLRTALENMRYAACTPEDIMFLKTRIAGR